MKETGHDLLKRFALSWGWFEKQTMKIAINGIGIAGPTLAY